MQKNIRSKTRNGPTIVNRKFLKVMTFNLGCEGHIYFVLVNKGEADIYYRQTELQCKEINVWNAKVCLVNYKQYSVSSLQGAKGCMNDANGAK